MFRRIVSAVILVPLLVILVAFAVANRQTVTVSFDPFNGAEPALALNVPLFIIILLAAIAGVAAGGSATWFRQRRWRRAARRHEADAREARNQLDDRKAARFTSPLGSPNALLRPPR